MKKLVMAMAIALAAVGAQAEMSPGNPDALGVGLPGSLDKYSGTAYLIYVTSLSRENAVTGFSAAGADYVSTINDAKVYSFAYNEGMPNGGGDSEVGADTYFVCFYSDSAKDYMYVSNVAALEGGQIHFGAQNSTSSADAKSASSGFSGAGWYSSSVPEPTSGLLMLLGVAGLALRRKRA